MLSLIIICPSLDLNDVAFGICRIDNGNLTDTLYLSIDLFPYELLYFTESLFRIAPDPNEMAPLIQ